MIWAEYTRKIILGRGCLRNKILFYLLTILLNQIYDRKQTQMILLNQSKFF